MSLLPFWFINDRIFIFGWTIPLSMQHDEVRWMQQQQLFFFVLWCTFEWKNVGQDLVLWAGCWLDVKMCVCAWYMKVDEDEFKLARLVFKWNKWLEKSTSPERSLLVSPEGSVDILMKHFRVKTFKRKCSICTNVLFTIHAIRKYMGWILISYFSKGNCS